MEDYSIGTYTLTIDQLREILKEQKITVEINGMFYEVKESEE